MHLTLRLMVDLTVQSSALEVKGAHKDLLCDLLKDPKKVHLRLHFWGCVWVCNSVVPLVAFVATFINAQRFTK